MYCPQCGTNLADDAQFCSNCGAPVAAVRTALVGEATPAEPTDPQTPSGAPIPPANSNAYNYSVADATIAKPQNDYYNTNYATTPQTSTGYVAPPVASPQATADFSATYPTNPQAAYAAPKEKSKAPFIVLGALALAALAIVAVVFLARGCTAVDSGSPEGVVLDATKAVLNLDVETALSYYPDEMVDHLVDQTGLSGREAFIGAINEGIHYSSEQLAAFGLDIREILSKAEYRVTGSTQFSDEDLADLKTRWNKVKPGFGDSFQDAAAVSLELSAKAEIFGQSISLSDYMGSLPQTITTVKINNKWYLLDSSLTELFGF